MSLSAAAEAINVQSARPGRWLREYVQRREEVLGRPILVRVGKGRQRPTFRVNMAELRATCPELFDPREPMVEAAREMVQSLRQGREHTEERFDDIDHALAAVLERLRAIEARLTVAKAS